MQQSQTIVNFAREEAAKTGYPVQHFGAVLSYTSRALAALSRQQADLERASRSTDYHPRPSAPEGETRVKGERRWQCLTDEQRQWRLGKAKSELFQASPFLAQVWKTGSPIHENTIRVRAMRALETESMELVLFDEELYVRYPWYPPLTQNLGL